MGKRAILRVRVYYRCCKCGYVSYKRIIKCPKCSGDIFRVSEHK